MATYKTHVALRESDGTPRVELACGRDYYGVRNVCTTIRLTDSDRVDWGSMDVQAFINDPESCRACIAGLRRLSGR